MDGLTEGRIVHYVIKEGVHRPAIVVNVWNVSGGCEGYINLMVFTDGSNDLMYFENLKQEAHEAIERGLLWKTSICYSEEPKPNTWHWIEKA